MTAYDWEIPEYTTVSFKRKQSPYCLCVPVINEGEKIQRQIIKLLQFSTQIDIIICDGGSTDKSLPLNFLEQYGVRTLLTKTGPGKLSAQLRMGYSYALTEGYTGVITIDGNGKDSIDSIPLFIKFLNQGYDFVQGSRFIPDGKSINTPLLRFLAIRLIHAPVISILARFYYTDTTNGYRAYSKRLLEDTHIAPFRNIFDTYELLAYLSVQAPRNGFRTIEIPVTRRYPKTEKIPTKISPFHGNLTLLRILLSLTRGEYNPH